MIGLNINLSLHNKQINKPMQQNVQSQRLPQGFNFSQDRNSIPSKLPNSQKKIPRYEPKRIDLSPNKLHKDEKNPSYKSRTLNEVKIIDQKIQKQKQLIQKLEKQNQLRKQQIQNVHHKSFHSLNSQLLRIYGGVQNISIHDQFQQTKTEADSIFLQGRKNQATKELQTEEQKYRENIRKMQFKKAQNRRKLKQDQQIPIKIMKFEDLQKKKQNNQNEIQNLENIVESKKLTENEQSKKQNNQKSIQNISKKSIVDASKKSQLIGSKKSQLVQMNVQSIPFEQNNLQKKSNSQNSQKKEIESKSKVTQKSSQKKYSVKVSSVIVPQINDSIKQIQQRKSQRKQERQASIKKSYVSSHRQKQEKIQPQRSDKLSQMKNSVHSSIKQAHQEKEDGKQQSQNQFVRSERKSIKQKSVSSKLEADLANSQQKSLRSNIEKDLIEAKLNPGVKQKTISVKSRQSSNIKQQKVAFMYVPHAASQNANKQFKKTDKSIQWSQVDISMYGRTNEVVDESRLDSRLNNQQSLLLPQTQQNNQMNQLQTSRIYMKKNKLVYENNFVEMSEKQLKSQKTINLNPIIIKNPKSQTSSHHSNSYRNSKGSFIASRQGSVRQKVDRYDKFQRDHSLKSQRVENKLAQIQNLNQQTQSRNKTPSYRSRKSNPINGSSISKSRVSSINEAQKSTIKYQSVKVEQNKNQQEEQNIKNESKVVVSKLQMNNLLSHIEKLQQKLSIIEQRQQKLAQQKTQQIIKLQHLILQQQKLQQEMKNSQFSIEKSQHQQQRISVDGDQNKEQQNVGQDRQSLLPSIESQSRQLEAINNQGYAKNEQLVENYNNIYIQIEKEQNKECPQVDEENHSIKSQKKQFIQENDQEQKKILQKSQISQRQTIQHGITHLAELQAKFSQQKSQLLDQITRLKKIIREMQIEKIKAIEQNRSLIQKNSQILSNLSNQDITNLANTINDDKLITHQIIDFKQSQIINGNSRSIEKQKEKSPFGKIVKNSPSKNGSRITQNHQSSQVSPSRKFRLNQSRRSSISSQSVIKNIESKEVLPQVQNNVKLNDQNNVKLDEQGDNSLQKKKTQFYPINEKEGYIVLQNQQNKKNENNDEEVNEGQNIQNQNQFQKGLQWNQHSKSRKIQITQEEILERFQRTNRQFNNFIESSRFINETKSSLASQNNLFEKTNRSGSFGNNHHQKSFINSEEDNPQNKILNKSSTSRLDLQIESNKKDNFQSSFTRIINELKNQQNKKDEEDDSIPQIKIRQLQDYQLPNTPDISYDQEQLMELAKETFSLFNIEVHHDDSDFNMKKYKNCVIFTKGSETILWHYNGKFYIGGWKGKQDGSGQKTGFGIEIIPDKHIYKGQFMNGKKHGTGILKSTNGNIYDGQWIDGIKNGLGIYFDATTKVTYEGQWKDGKKNGYGLLKFSPKQYYKGTFVKSVKDGYGIEVFVNGDKYRGQYRRGKFHGKGKYSWANQSVYEGDFYEGMRHGHGTWRSAKINPDVFVGSYENDKKSGYGRYVWPNGCIYEGNFSEDVKHGKGRLIYTDGRQIKGVWQEGSLLQAITQNPKQYQQEELLKKSGKFKIK